MTPVWIETAVVLEIHREQIAQFGGVPGIREPNNIESALARPRHLYTYERPDLCDLAAAYTAGLCQNHGFVDGNKRTAFLVSYIFLARNGHMITAEQPEVIAAILSLADHTLTEAGYANWVREHVVAL